MALNTGMGCAGGGGSAPVEAGAAPGGAQGSAAADAALDFQVRLKAAIDGSDEAEVERLFRAMEPPAHGLVCVNGACVKPKAVRWLWPGRIPLGKLTLLMGDPGLGKSMVTADLAARVTRGGPWPGQPEGAPLTKPGRVIFLCAEDDPEDTIVPRLVAAGADMVEVTMVRGAKVLAGWGGGMDPFELERHLENLDQLIAQTPRTALVVIDPISAYMGKADGNSNSQVRGVLTPVAELAQRHGCAILAITHLNKAQGASGLYRACGSVAYTAAARAVWLAAKDKNDPERRVLMPLKMNLGQEPPGIGFRVSVPEAGGDDDAASAAAALAPRVEWDDEPVVMTPDEAVGAAGAVSSGGLDDDACTRRDLLGDAKAFIRSILADGKTLSAVDVFDAAKDAGFGRKIVQSAKTSLGIVSRRKGFGPEARYVWALPVEAGESKAPQTPATTAGPVAPTLSTDPDPERPLPETAKEAVERFGGELEEYPFVGW